MLISFLRCLSFWKYTWKLFDKLHKFQANVEVEWLFPIFYHSNKLNFFALTWQKLIDQKRVQLSISGKHNELLISSNNNINIINPSTSDLWSRQTLKLDGNLNKINDRCETKNRQFVDGKKFRLNRKKVGKIWKFETQ